MISEKKIAANRLNAKKSTGPRTQRGKSRASRNAWRHGWAAAKKGFSKDSVQVRCMAKAICAGHAVSAPLYEQAVIIAECEALLLGLRAARAAAIQRNRIIGSTPRPAGHQRQAVDSLPELVALDRYERRAFSRRKRAIRTFGAISIVTPFLGHDGGRMVTTEEQARVP